MKRIPLKEISMSTTGHNDNEQKNKGHARKSDPASSEPVKREHPSTDQAITDTLETNYMPYAMSVIVSRAIPEIDGFKPSHRKLLYTMYKMGL